MAIARRAKRIVSSLLLGWWLPLVAIALWWALPAKGSLYFPRLGAILTALKDDWLGSAIRTDVLPSLEHLAAGYAFALVGGVLIALLLTTVPILYNATLPLITFFRALPSPALIPPLLLVFGLGGEFKIFIIAFASIWPILLNSYDGFQSLNLVQRETARSYHFTPWQRMVEVVIPAASPQIAVGARNGLQTAIVVTVASEFLASTQGIGYLIDLDQTTFNPTGVWAGVLLLGLIGVVLNLLFVAVERRVLAWHIGMRAIDVPR